MIVEASQRKAALDDSLLLAGAAEATIFDPVQSYLQIFTTLSRVLSTLLPRLSKHKAGTPIPGHILLLTKEYVLVVIQKRRLMLFIGFLRFLSIFRLLTH